MGQRFCFVGAMLLCLSVSACCSDPVLNNDLHYSAPWKPSWQPGGGVPVTKAQVIIEEAVQSHEKKPLNAKKPLKVKTPGKLAKLKKLSAKKLPPLKNDDDLEVARLPAKKMETARARVDKGLGRAAEDASARLQLLRTVDDVSLPQSILFDQKRLRFYVSRLGRKQEGDKMAGNEVLLGGTIALLARDGSVINPVWVKGLDQPRGMALVGQHLYVADGKALVEIDIDKAKVINRFEMADVFYFNDVVAGENGVLYVSSPLNNSIYSFLKEEGLQLWLQSQELSGPNGLAIADGVLFVCSIGLVKTDDGMAAGGGLFRVDMKSKTLSKLSKDGLPPFASLQGDGEGHLYLTDDGGAKLLKFDLQGKLLEQIDVRDVFDLKDTAGLGDFHYMVRSKEFWVPVKSNGHILVFGRSDAQLIGEELRE